MTDSPQFAITLCVPDGTIRKLNDCGGLRGVILDGLPELDFLPPPWWEGSHTARLGLIQVQGASPREREGNSGEEGGTS